VWSLQQRCYPLLLLTYKSIAHPSYTGKLAVGAFRKMGRHSACIKWRVNHNGPVTIGAGEITFFLARREQRSSTLSESRIARLWACVRPGYRRWRSSSKSRSPTTLTKAEVLFPLKQRPAGRASPRHIYQDRIMCSICPDGKVKLPEIISRAVCIPPANSTPVVPAPATTCVFR
jgi:hypothetical protein